MNAYVLDLTGDVSSRQLGSNIVTYNPKQDN